MMTLKVHKPLLQYLQTAKPLVARAITRTIDDDQIQMIGMICANLLSGAIKVAPVSRSALSQHAEIIRKIGKKQIKVKTRRTLIYKHIDIVLQVIKASFNKLYPKNNGSSTASSS